MHNYCTVPETTYILRQSNIRIESLINNQIKIKTMTKVLDGLFYSESHEYVKVEGDEAYIGITDYAQHELGNIVYVDLPDVDDEVNAGDDFGAVESVKAASDLTAPVSGTVVEVNEKLEDQPELINKDAFANWIIKVKLTDKTELDSLMSAEDYKKMIEA
jgi:glycine cleavage system H protein